ncbi:MAG TPA: hypothetical protein VKB76_07600, partial [Ktedonobacterales bacterium]|nr:hypothetical protein [Ktedonobacterales bacterium]
MGIGVAVDGILVGLGVFGAEGVWVADGLCVPEGSGVPEATCVAMAICVAWFFGGGALDGSAVLATACTVAIPCVEVAICVSSLAVFAVEDGRPECTRNKLTLTSDNSRAAAISASMRRDGRRLRGDEIQGDGAASG